MSKRIINHDVLEVIKKRWSPRAFERTEVPNEALLCVLEAARLAPSSSNEQPWRFIVATQEPTLNILRSSLNEFNYEWAHKAPVLIAFLSKKLTEKGRENAYHRFDLGAAWAFMTLEATHQGLSMHAMGGFDKDKVRQDFKIEEDLDVVMIAALGSMGNPEALSEKLQAREEPNERKSLEEIILKLG
jgi:nitroreductase